MDRDEGRETDSSPPDELVERVSEGRRQLLKVLLGGMAAYSVPLMASFSMEGLRFGTAQAGGPQFCPPGLAGPGELPPGQPFTLSNQTGGDLPRGRPFNGSNPPGRPFNEDCFTVTSIAPVP